MSKSKAPRYRSHNDILKLWETYAALSRDLSAMGFEISSMGVARWGQSGRIPPKWYPYVIEAAKKRGHSLSLELLHKLRPVRLPFDRAEAVA